MLESHKPFLLVHSSKQKQWRSHHIVYAEHKKAILKWKKEGRKEREEVKKENDELHPGRCKFILGGGEGGSRNTYCTLLYLHLRKAYARVLCSRIRLQIKLGAQGYMAKLLSQEQVLKFTKKILPFPSFFGRCH